MRIRDKGAMFQGQVLGIVYRTIATHLIRKAGYTTTTSHTGAVTLINAFQSDQHKLYTSILRGSCNRRIGAETANYVCNIYRYDVIYGLYSKQL